jgi:hypothetical protein
MPVRPPAASLVRILLLGFLLESIDNRVENRLYRLLAVDLLVRLNCSLAHKPATLPARNRIERRRGNGAAPWIALFEAAARVNAAIDAPQAIEPHKLQRRANAAGRNFQPKSHCELPGP